MNQVKETLTGFLIGIGIYTVLIEAVGLFFSEDILSYTLGLLFGVIVAIFLIIHMAKTLDKALDLPQQQANKYVKRQSFFRLFIMLIALVIGLLVDRMNFIALILGMLGLKIGALIAPFFLKRLYPESFVTKEEEEE
ncbi:MAG: ATP synthase subunit I [Lachnospiraceae bacterium]